MSTIVEWACCVDDVFHCDHGPQNLREFEMSSQSKILGHAVLHECEAHNIERVSDLVSRSFMSLGVDPTNLNINWFRGKLRLHNRWENKKLWLMADTSLRFPECCPVCLNTGIPLAILIPCGHITCCVCCPIPEVKCPICRTVVLHQQTNVFT